MIIPLFYENKEISHPSIFLAGPCLKGGSFHGSWREEAINILNDLGFDGYVYVPESQKGVYEEEDLPFETTTRWEWERLKDCDVILFWVPRDDKDLPGFTTNIEFGRYTAIRPGSVILGYPESATRMKYMEILYKNVCGRTSSHTLKDTCLVSLSVIKRKKKNGGFL